MKQLVMENGNKVDVNMDHVLYIEHTQRGISIIHFSKENSSSLDVKTPAKTN